MATLKPRCLIVERHPYETGKDQKQPQIPSKPFAAFFGPGGNITVELFEDGVFKRRVIGLASAYNRRGKTGKRASETYRLQSIEEFKNLPPGFFFIEEVLAGGIVTHYEIWFRQDKAAVLNDIVTTHGPFEVAPKGAMPSRGRMHKIVSAPVSKVIGNS
jgi:hypothetical protein